MIPGASKKTIAFYTPDYDGEADCFGCASFGIAGFAGVRSKAFRRFGIEPVGIEISGTYGECLRRAERIGHGGSIQAAIVLLGNAGGENEFVRRLSAALNCPVVGGGAAINPDTDASGLISRGGEANLLLIADERFDVEISCRNLHTRVLSEHRLELKDARTLLEVDGCDATAWLAKKKSEYGIAQTDWEHLTFADRNGVNAHLSLQGGAVVSGRDLECVMALRCAEQGEVLEGMRAFYDDEDAIVFGCAGLRGLLETEIETKALGLFLFGEVCYANGRAAFGNLMLSKLAFVAKNKSASGG